MNLTCKQKDELITTLAETLDVIIWGYQNKVGLTEENIQRFIDINLRAKELLHDV